MKRKPRLCLVRLLVPLHIMTTYYSQAATSTTSASLEEDDSFLLSKMHKCPSAICLFYPNPSERQIKHALDGVECSVPGEIIGVKQLAQRHNCRRWLSLQVIRVQWKLNRQALQIKCFIFNFHSPPRGTDFYFLLIQFVLRSLHLGFYYEIVSFPCAQLGEAAWRKG